MSRLNKSPFLASASYSLEHERLKVKTFCEEHLPTMMSIRNAIKVSKPVAGSKVVKLAAPVWVMIGSTSLETGVNSFPVETATYVNEGATTFCTTFSLSYGAAEFDVVDRMITALLIGLPEIALLLAEAEALARSGAGDEHPHILEITSDLAEFALGIQHAMVGAALDRIVDEEDLKVIADERSVFPLH
jgi:hypothetical protein